MIHRFFSKPHPVKSILKPLFPQGLRKRLRERMLSALRNRNLTKPPFPAEVRRQLAEEYGEDVPKLQAHSTGSMEVATVEPAKNGKAWATPPVTSSPCPAHAPARSSPFSAISIAVCNDVGFPTGVLGLMRRHRMSGSLAFALEAGHPVSGSTAMHTAVNSPFRVKGLQHRLAVRAEG
jgi:hypothetical protein